MLFVHAHIFPNPTHLSPKMLISNSLELTFSQLRVRGGEQLSSNKGLSTVAIAIGIIAIVLSGFSLATLYMPAPVAEPTSRTIYMNAIEPKGSTNISSEPFPTETLPPGGGYKLIPPDEDGKWVVETYIWEPSVIVVYEGDDITLKILGINGAQHTASIENYVNSFTVKRGHLTTLNFVADKAGTFKIECSTHQPAMTGYLLVLPRA